MVREPLSHAPVFWECPRCGTIYYQREGPACSCWRERADLYPLPVRRLPVLVRWVPLR